MSRRTVERCISRLAEIGVIKINRRLNGQGARTSSSYSLDLMHASESRIPPSESRRGSVTESHTPRHSDVPPPSESRINLEENLELNQEENQADFLGGSPPKKPQKIEYPNWLNLDLWADFKKYRRAMGKFTAHSEKLNLTKLKDLCPNGRNHEQIINRTIEHEWKGFYPLESDRTKSNSTQGLPEL